MKIIVGVPCYNCRKQISRVLSGLENIEKDIEEFVFVDNYSRDGTANYLEELKKQSKIRNKLKIFKNAENYGLGGSHKIIFKYAIKINCDFVVIIHGDDQASVTDIKRLKDVAVNKKCTALGSRFMKESVLKGYQRTRFWGNRVLNLIFSVVSGKKTLDLGSGLNVFEVSAIRSLDLNKLSNEFNFNVDLLLELYRLNICHKFEPISWREEDQVSNAKNFDVAISMLRSLFRWRFGIAANYEVKKFSFREF